MQADYTRKTQELAEHRRGLDSEREAFTKESEARRQSEKDIGRVAVMDEQLEQYGKVDWAALRAANPELANQHFQDMTILRDQRDRLAAQVHKDVQQRQSEAQQSFAKRYQETNATLARDIKGWNQDLADKLRDFALASGVTPDQLRDIATNAPAVKLLHKAWLGEQLSTAKPAAKPLPLEPKPVATVSGARARNAVNLFDASMDDYVAARRKQGFGKR